MTRSEAVVCHWYLTCRYNSLGCLLLRCFKTALGVVITFLCGCFWRSETCYWSRFAVAINLGSMWLCFFVLICLCEVQVVSVPKTLLWKLRLCYFLWIFGGDRWLSLRLSGLLNRCREGQAYRCFSGSGDVLLEGAHHRWSLCVAVERGSECWLIWGFCCQANCSFNDQPVWVKDLPAAVL